IAAFGATPQTNPYFTSANGGNQWDHFVIHTYFYTDTTEAWSTSGVAYAVNLNPGGGGVNPSIVFGRSPNPQIDQPAHQFMVIPNSQFSNGRLPPDQPHIAVTNVNGNDQIYAGFSDVNEANAPCPGVPGAMGTGKTAKVRYSLNPGAGNPVFTTVTIETGVPGAGCDGPVDVAAIANR